MPNITFSATARIKLCASGWDAVGCPARSHARPLPVGSFAGCERPGVMAYLIGVSEPHETPIYYRIRITPASPVKL